MYFASVEVSIQLNSYLDFVKQTYMVLTYVTKCIAY